MSAVRIIVPLVLAVVVVGVVVFRFTSPDDAALPTVGDAGLIQVEVAPAMAVEAEALSITAEVRPAEAIPVVSGSRGSVQSIEVEDGETVRAGQLLLRLEQSSQRADLMSARAELDQAQDVLERARRRVEEGLLASGAIENAERDVVAARAKLTAAEEAVEAFNVRAPFAGVVDVTELARGERVEPQTTVATLTNPAERVVRFEAPRRLTSGLSVGDRLPVSAASAGGGAVEGEIVISTLEVVPGSAPPATAVSARLGGGFATRPPDGEVDVLIGGKGAAVTAVPRAALVEGDGQVRVFRIVQGVARATPVQPQPTGTAAEEPGETVPVRGALKPGDRVAISRLDELRDGMRVAVTGTEER